jgi:hypothetical protein
MKIKILFIIRGICYLIIFGILIYIGIYSIQHDYLTNPQIFKLFYKEYIVIILLYLIPNFILNNIRIKK